MTDDSNYVSVKGPNNRHIPVHKSIQARLPEHFPLAEEKAARKSPARKRQKAQKVTPVEVAAPVTEIIDTKDLDNGN